MTRLLHIGSSPRGAASESLQIAEQFLATYRERHPDHEVETWDLWDGSLPAFGPAAAGAKMTVFGGGAPQAEQAAAWREAPARLRAFRRRRPALVQRSHWNAGVPLCAAPAIALES